MNAPLITCSSNKSTNIRSYLGYKSLVFTLKLNHASCTCTLERVGHSAMRSQGYYSKEVTLVYFADGANPFMPSMRSD